MELELWHGTNQTFEVFDRAHLGLHTANGASTQAFFLAGDFETARSYALGAARKLVPDAKSHEDRVATLLRRADRALAAGSFDSYETLLMQAEDMEAAAIQAPPGGCVVLGCRVSLEDPFVIDGSSREVVTNLAGVLKRAGAAGHDAVILRDILDTPDGLGPVDDHVAVFDPAKIDIVTRTEVGVDAPADASVDALAEPG